MNVKIIIIIQNNNLFINRTCEVTNRVTSQVQYLQPRILNVIFY